MGDTLIREIYILPPMAFARVGSSNASCAAFSWAEPEISPDGPTGLRLAPEVTYEVSADGELTESIPNQIDFKDSDNRFCPVSPFFEIWGVWGDPGGEFEGPLTIKVLTELGLSLGDVKWTISLGNLKAYHFTLNEGDRIAGEATSNGDQHQRISINGVSPAGTGIEPLIAAGKKLPMGEFQVVKPRNDDDPLRMRFTPPHGLVYGPPNLKQRIDDNSDVLNPSNGELLNADWVGFDLPETNKIVNASAVWATLDLRNEGPPPVGAGDPRNSPGGLSARLYERRGSEEEDDIAPISMGLVDDVSDGLVTCEVAGQKSCARLVVGPPDMAPANRPAISLQDGLSDRELRQESRDQPLSPEELEEIVADIFERALETSELMNKDAQNDRARSTNFDPRNPNTDLPSPGRDYEPDPRNTLWRTTNPNTTTSPAPAVGFSGDAMPVSDKGRRKHRRYAALEYLRDRLREEPDLIEKWIRSPREDSVFYDRRMPALMRGSDGLPIHLTRRQYEMLQRWAKRQIV